MVKYTTYGTFNPNKIDRLLVDGNWFIMSISLFLNLVGKPIQ